MIHYAIAITVVLGSHTFHTVDTNHSFYGDTQKSCNMVANGYRDAIHTILKGQHRYRWRYDVSCIPFEHFARL